ncbi:MAG: multidrug transporter [Betaproteobacteria bacterium]|nr:multidrug transporter [Betaproteobacteria bacterium]
MSTQQLIYESAVPVSHARHGTWSVEVGGDYGFATAVNSMPLMAVEFPPASAEYAIVFAGNQDAVMPAVILGVRAAENLFVTDGTHWGARYVPAFARRYPFIFASAADGQTFTLCIDEAFPGFNQTGKGAALFEADGKPSAYTQNVLRFLQEYQAQFQRTQQFCRKLREHDLLEPMQAQITTAGGEKLSLSGFMTVSRDRLKALSADVLAEMARTDELELVYLHLASMRNFQSMVDRLGATAPPAKETGAEVAAEAPATETRH